MIITYEEYYPHAMDDEHGRSNSIKGRWRETTPEHMTYAIGMLLGLLGPGRAFLEIDGKLHGPFDFRDAPRRSQGGMKRYAARMLQQFMPEPELEKYAPMQFGL